MSFGFSVGDFIAVIQLANTIRNDFAGAPSQFAEASDLVKSLSIILNHAGNIQLGRELDKQETAELEHIAGCCQKVLTELKHVLDTNSELKQRQESFSIKRVWKRLNWRPDDISHLRARVSVSIDLLNIFTGSVVRQDQRRQDVLKWLTPIDSASEQNAFFSHRQAGTGQWLLNSNEFKAWVKTSKQTLFCRGIPGAGKTILTSIVVNELSTRFQNDSSIVVVYLYCKFKEQDEQKPEDLLAQLLKQLAEGKSPLPKSVQALYDRCKAQKTLPSIDDISAVLQLVVAEYSRVFILVDALDECRAQSNCRETLLSRIFSLQKYGVNFFATSRDMPEITKEFQQSLVLDILADEQDLRRYVESRIPDLPSFVRGDSDRQEKVKAEIVKVVDGVFLLARLHLDSLTTKTAPKQFLAALQDLPTGADAYKRVYDYAMVRINRQLPPQVELAKRVLSWLTCAKRDLSIKELEHALGVRVGEPRFDKDNITGIEDIVPICAGLITVDEQNNRIRLAHYTTQKYFESTLTEHFPTAEFDITEICVTYLSFTVFESGICRTDSSFEERLQLNPLYEYAACYWGHHARQASTLYEGIVDFLQCESKVEAATQAMLAHKRYPFYAEYSQAFPKRIMGPHLAAYFGLTEPIEVILRSSYIVSTDEYGQTPLLWAAKRGHDAVVKQLLDSEKTIDADWTDCYRRTALSWAAANGHGAVVKLLLDSDKVVDADSEDEWNRRTALSWAAGNGHGAVVKLLLDSDKVININSQDSEGLTALLWAVKNRHEVVLKQLLDSEKFVDINSIDKMGLTALLWAVKNRHEAVLKQLLETGKAVNADLKGRHGRTALSWAAESGYEATVKLLLDSDKVVDADSKDKDGETALSWAAGSGHGAVVKLLLDSSKVKDGRTALLRAVSKGHDTIVKQLLDSDKAIDGDSKDDEGWTALLLAARLGCEAVVKLLLDSSKVIDGDSKDKLYGRTALWWAAEHGHEAVVKLLLDSDKVIDTDSKEDRHGQTALSCAAMRGHEVVVRQLLDSDKVVNTNSKDKNGWTALSWAAGNGHEAVVKQLLDSGKVKDTDSKSNRGETPIWLAAARGNEAVVRLLLETGKVNADSKDGFGRTALSVAAENGHEVIAQLLRDYITV
ncbi:hypothetical protein IFR05_012001 [Cadophora sp. M221]|nr:hypothetical protein IFR05_012001 [Cadophora sp. M221]